MRGRLSDLLEGESINALNYPTPVTKERKSNENPCNVLVWNMYSTCQRWPLQLVWWQSSSSRKRKTSDALENVTSIVAQEGVERMLAGDWSQVGIDVSNAMEPLLQSYVADANVSDCLG